MITTLTGENSYSLGNELKRRTDSFLAEHGDIALERIDAEETEFERIRESLNSLPFLASRKLVVLRAPGKQKKFIESFEKLLDNLTDTTDLIIVEPKLDKRLSYYKYLKSRTDFHEFSELDQGGLARWLCDAAKKGGGSLDFADAKYMVERIGVSQQLAANELEKLLLYNPKITRESINALTEESPQSSIFQLLEAAFAGNSRRALELYAEQRAQKTETQQIVAMLAWQLHVLAIVKTAGDRTTEQIANEAKINPFTVRKSQAIARKLSLAGLKSLTSELLDIDIATKRTSIDPDEALKLYLLKLGRS